MTPQQIIDAWNAQADEANQWGALGEDEKLMWAYKQATAEAKKQEPDDLTIAYMSGLYDGKKMRQWVGLTEDDWDEIFGNALTIGEAIKLTEAKLKEKNT